MTSATKNPEVDSEDSEFVATNAIVARKDPHFTPIRRCVFRGLAEAGNVLWPVTDNAQSSRPLGRPLGGIPRFVLATVWSVALQKDSSLRGVVP